MRRTSLIFLLCVLPSVVRADYEFKTIDYPGAEHTHVNDINDDGVAVGDYQLPFETRRHAFRYEKGIYTNIDPVGLAGPSADYIPYGITNDGRIVGSYGFNFAATHGYLTIGGVTSTFDKPGQNSGNPARINNLGDIVGYQSDGTGPQKGYVYSAGSFRDLTDDFSAATGLNDAGVITGTYRDFARNRFLGFRLTGTSFTVIDPLGGAEGGSSANDINNAETIVGSYDHDGDVHGFVYEMGLYTTIDVPG